LADALTVASAAPRILDQNIFTAISPKSPTLKMSGHCHIEQVEAAPPAWSEELTYWNHTLQPSLAGE
jgi:hypothetical protein